MRRQGRTLSFTFWEEHWSNKHVNKIQQKLFFSFYFFQQSFYWFRRWNKINFKWLQYLFSNHQIKNLQAHNLQGVPDAEVLMNGRSGGREHPHSTICGGLCSICRDSSILHLLDSEKGWHAVMINLRKRQNYIYIYICQGYIHIYVILL